jgi:hypothetical protein
MLEAARALALTVRALARDPAARAAVAEEFRLRSTGRAEPTAANPRTSG